MVINRESYNKDFSFFECINLGFKDYFKVFKRLWLLSILLAFFSEYTTLFFEIIESFFNENQEVYVFLTLALVISSFLILYFAVITQGYIGELFIRIKSNKDIDKSEMLKSTQHKVLKILIINVIRFILKIVIYLCLVFIFLIINQNLNFENIIFLNKYAVLIVMILLIFVNIYIFIRIDMNLYIHLFNIEHPHEGHIDSYLLTKKQFIKKMFYILIANIPLIIIVILDILLLSFSSSFTSELIKWIFLLVIMVIKILSYTYTYNLYFNLFNEIKCNICDNTRGDWRLF